MGKRGPKPMVPTEEEIEMVLKMALAGITNEQISMCIRDGIDVKTMKTYFGDIIQRGKAVAHAELGANIYQRAVDGDNTMACFYAKCRMGWKETTVQEHAGELTLIERVIVKAKN